jgi:hypothetical protein
MNWVKYSIADYMKRYEYSYEEAIDDMIKELEEARDDEQLMADSIEDSK